MHIATRDRRSGFGRVPAWAGPVVGACCAAGAAAYVAVHDPADGGLIACPFYASTGIWCPGCGCTRALHHLLRGDIAGSISNNVFLPLFVIGTAALWLTWFNASTGRRPPTLWTRIPQKVWAGVIVAFVCFAVARNLPVQPFTALAPN